MIKEGIDRIEALVNKGADPRVVKLPADPQHVNRVYFPGKSEFRTVVSDPTPRQYRALSILGFIDQVRMLTESESSAFASTDCAVFVGDKTITCIYDEDGERRDRTVMPLQYSTPFDILSSKRLDSINQKDLDWLLRSQFRGSVVPEKFAADVKKLKFSKNAAGTSEVSQGRESMGRTIEAEVAGLDGAFLEEVVFNVPVYENAGHNGEHYVVPVLCAVNVDANAATFTIQPVSGEIDKAKSDARNWIAQRIRMGCPDETVVLVDSEC